MKKISIAFLSLAACCLLACNGNKTSETTTDSDTSVTNMDTSASRMTDTSGTRMADTSTMSRAATPVNKDDSEFIIKAASGGMMEVELGKLAQDKAASQRVKDFGNMMVTDHSKANDDLKSLASSKKYYCPFNYGKR